jgi:small subunit ribosomal protein S1
MANEVINETEDSKENETSAIEETQTETAVETPAEETAETAETATATAAATETPVDETTAATATVEAPAEETPVSEAQEETAVEAAAEETPVSPASETTDEEAEEQQNSNEMDFGAILQKFEQEQTIYHSGELVEGKVVGVSDRGVLIDFGYKSEGVVPLEEFTTPEGETSVREGDNVQVVIRSIHTGDAPPVLSRYDALRRKAWDEIEKAYNDETPITGRVIDRTKGGLRVDINGVEAFLPGSQIDSRPIRSLDAYRGKDIEAKVIKFSRKRNNIVLSRKILTDEVVNKQKAETLGAIEEGYVIEGTVKNLTEYGAFVDIGGIDGLLHVTDMSWGRQPTPGEQFKVGSSVQVKVLKLDREKEKVSLGYKQLIPDPWQTVPELYPVGARFKGKVSSVTDYGAFIELEPGIEGLVHVSEMSWSKNLKSPRKILRKDEEVEVQVLGIDTEAHRISLGMKQLMPNPWETVGERYHVGDRVHGKVRNITDFGAFVEIEDGIDGLVHVSDISWSKKIKHPKDVLVRDQEVDAIITSIDRVGHRMSLSMKDIAPSEWETFVATHKPGDIVRGKVSRFAGFGVFVELGNELEGLCHISELSDERVERPEDVVKLGQEMDFKILRIEHDDQKIGLSARAVSSEGETAVDSRSYSTEAKGGMASLGELANLKFGRGSDEEAKEEQPKLSKKERKALKAQERAAAEAAGTATETDATAPETESGEAATAETSAETETTGETEAAETEAVIAEEAKTEETGETAAETETAETTVETSEAEEAPVAETSAETSEAEETPVAETAETSEAEDAPVAEAEISQVEETVGMETAEEQTAAAESVETPSETAEETSYPGASEAEGETLSLTDAEGEAESAAETTEARDEAVAEAEGASETESTDAQSEEKSA